MWRRKAKAASVLLPSDCRAEANQVLRALPRIVVPVELLGAERPVVGGKSDRRGSRATVVSEVREASDKLR